MNYHCPRCARKPEVRSQCRLDEETRAKEEEERRAKEKMEKEKEDRGKADSVAGAAYEFWTLMGEVMEEVLIPEDLPGPITELPVTTPDSITVTTEFGVSEEPSSITVITAGPPPTTNVLEVEEEEEMHFVHELTLVNNTVSSPTGPDSPMDVEVEDLADDEEEDAGFDENDFVALIDEFIDDDVISTATTAAPSDI